MPDRKIAIHIGGDGQTFADALDILVESMSCEGLPDKARCIKGMIYIACYDPQCFNENCTYLGLCEDPRHEKKDEKTNAESQA